EKEEGAEEGEGGGGRGVWGAALGWRSGPGAHPGSPAAEDGEGAWGGLPLQPRSAVPGPGHPGRQGLGGPHGSRTGRPGKAVSLSPGCGWTPAAGSAATGAERPGPGRSCRREKAAAGGSAHRHWDLAQRTRGQTAAIATSGRAMDPHEMVVKNPYSHISIPRAHLRPDLEQQLEVAPSSESQPLPVGSCTPEPTRLLQPTEEALGPKGAKGAKGAAPVQGQQAWQQPGNPYGSEQRPAGLTYAGLPPVGRGDDIAHHCCCCPCCSCCHCPRFCRCHSCCVVS
uniref:Cysteine rich tail 1 n=1 Tax=Equus caballus TaxID=9796 RepID=A0A9L0S8N3_HORSE